MRYAGEIAQIERRLSALGTPERAAREKRYLKSDLEFLELRVPEVREIARVESIDRIAGLTLREAVKYLEDESRQDLLERYRSRWAVELDGR